LAADTVKVVNGVYAFSPFNSEKKILLAVTERGLNESLESSIQRGLPEGAQKSEVLASEIERHLSSGPSQIVIFADALATVDDPWLAESDVAPALRVALYGNEIYYLLLAEDVGSERIAKTVNAGSFNDYFVGFFTELVGGDKSFPITLSSDNISMIVKCVSSMVVGAFDGESFLRFQVAGK
jgi:hypothetical protein